MTDLENPRTSIELSIPPAHEWHEREKRQTREAIGRAASYATQSLMMACATGFPRHVACGEQINEIEGFILARLSEANGV